MIWLNEPDGRGIKAFGREENATIRLVRIILNSS